MKITTKTGDGGETSLFGGRRVKKNDVFIEMVGLLDELQSLLGLCKFLVDEDILYVVERIQSDLYRMMSICGFEFKVPSNIANIGKDDVEFLDNIMIENQPLVADITAFSLPGGSEASCKFDVARAVCRRVERFFVGCNIDVPADILKYLNRLSDVLFVFAVMLKQKA